MNKLPFIVFILFLLFSADTLYAQTGAITGKVIDEQSGAPLLQANVFLSNTSKSAQTHADGSFALNQIPQGQYELLVSFVGYKPYSQKVTINGNSVELNIQLSPATIALNEIKIKSGVTNSQADLKRFIDIFLGKSDNAGLCRIINPEVLDINYDGEKHTLEASTGEFLKIDNLGLGYRIHVQLEDLNVNYLSGLYAYKGKIFFEELTGTPSELKTWKKNRFEVYEGSLRHFYRSLYQNTTAANGFEIRQVVSKPNPAKASAGIIEQKLENLIAQAKLANKDSLAYWRNQQKLPDLDYTVLPKLLNEKDIFSTTVTPGIYKLKFTDHIYIRSILKKSLNINTAQTPTWTMVKLRGDSALFDHNGILLDQNDVIYQGSRLEKIADMLPYDYAPENKGEPVRPPIPLEAISKTETKLLFEKVYLHTDRDVYMPGDTIWFKAYLVNAQNNMPIGTSSNLYVELINADSAKIGDREIIRLENGKGNGDFRLTDSIPSGRYTLRAYTNWMRNFGYNFVFEKNITIYNTEAKQVPIIADNKQKKAAVNKNTNVDAQPVILTQPVNVHFYPEGGSLVEGLNSLVAVKAEDVAGKGATLKGAILNTADDTVSRFSCDSSGMGILSILPLAGQQYKASFRYKNRDYTTTLPQALTKGLAMRISSNDSLLTVLMTSNDTSNNNLTLTGRHGGISYLNQQIALTNGQAVLKIPKSIFPEGIAAITLYDEQNKPNCERLVYVHHQNNLTLTITTDKPFYQPKGKTTVKLKLSDTTQRTNLSVAVVDESLVPAQSDNIASYLLLTSEIKGNIEHPERYFDTTNTNRFKQLDLLLMTQGWRDFLWRRIADSAIRISYATENGIDITGKVKNERNDKLLPGLNITLYASAAKGTKLFSDVTDSTGRFLFSGLKYYGDHPVKLSATNAKGEKTGAFFMDTMTVLPVQQQMQQKITDTTSAIIAAAINKRQEALKAVNFKGNNQLKEVKIKARKTFTLNDMSVMTFGYPDQVFDIAKKDEYYQALDNWMAHNVKGATVTDGPGVQFLGISKKSDLSVFLYPLFIVNGREIYTPNPQQYSNLDNQEKLAENDDNRKMANAIMKPYFDLPMNKIKTVTFKHLVGLDPDTGKFIDVFALYLTIDDDALAAYNQGTLAAPVNGYYTARTFYKPVYDTPQNLNKPDYRTTIHWESNITTDAKGEATVSFYNADPKTSVRIVAEGITAQGAPVVGTTIYTIK